jgi:hypothetical protein
MGIGRYGNLPYEMMTILASDVGRISISAGSAVAGIDVNTRRVIHGNLPYEGMK